MTVFVDTSALLAIATRMTNTTAKRRRPSGTARDRRARHPQLRRGRMPRPGPPPTWSRSGRPADGQHLSCLDDDLGRRAPPPRRVGGPRAASSSNSLVDQVSFEIMRREGIVTAFAFDSDFEAQGFERPPWRAGPKKGGDCARCRPRISLAPPSLRTSSASPRSRRVPPTGQHGPVVAAPSPRLS